MPRPYFISEEQKLQLASVVVLENMVKTPRAIPVLLEDGDEHLEPVLDWLHGREYVEIVDSQRYEVTERGKDTLGKFMARYMNFVKTMDVYCAIDLEEGSFAFSRFHDFDDDSDWFAYIDRDEWDDLRIAVAELKGLDPVEIVMMSFLHEGRLETEEPRWQARLMDVFDAIQDICNAAISLENLGYETDDGSVAGEDVLKDIITQGAELLIELKRQEPDDDDGDDGDDGGDEDEFVEEYTVETYQPYVNPYYVAPIWGGVWLM